jgi:hypothetical protein
MKQALLFAVCCVLLALATAALPRGPAATLDYTFDQFLQEFPKKQLLYSNNSNEYKTRKEIFEAELLDVVTHNAGNHPWTKSLNEFSDLTMDEFILQYTGQWLSKTEQEPLHEYTRQSVANSLLNADGGSNEPSLIADTTGLPPFVDWSARRRGTRALRSQGRCGSCYSQVASALMEYYISPQAGRELPLSTQQAVSCFPNPNFCGSGDHEVGGGCNGYTSGHVMNEYMKDIGVVSEEDYPYVSGDGEVPECSYDPAKMHIVAKTSGARRLTPNDPTELLRTLANFGPTSVSVAGSGVKNYFDGVLTNCTGAWQPEYNMYDVTLSHAMILVGYGVDAKTGLGYWKLQNSWGDGWSSRNGFAYIYRPLNGEAEGKFIDMKPSSGYTCRDDPQTPFIVTGTCGILANTWVPIDPVYIPKP